MAPFESTGFSAKAPVGRGAVRTWIATGPYAVNCTWRSYVTPGMSRLRTSWACAGPARTPAASAAMRTLLSTTRARTVAEPAAGPRVAYRLITRPRAATPRRASAGARPPRPRRARHRSSAPHRAGTARARGRRRAPAMPQRPAHTAWPPADDLRELRRG